LANVRAVAITARDSASSSTRQRIGQMLRSTNEAPARRREKKRRTKDDERNVRFERFRRWRRG